jgi:signal transduction histidine kinase
MLVRGDGFGLEDPTGSELHWTVRTPQAIGLVVLGVLVVVAVQRHEFTSPNAGWLLIAVIALPWVLDMIGWPRRLFREQARVQYPMAIVWSVVVVVCVYWLCVALQVNSDAAPFVLVVLIAEMTATINPQFGALIVAASTAAVLLLYFVNHFTPLSGQAIWIFAFAVGWLGGASYRSLLRIATKLEKAQDELASRAAEEERHRLARDIHDLIAHSLAVTMLQLSGARLALEAGDSDEALAALTDAEAAGRAAMAEIHRTVGLLGQGGDERPTPCASDLPELLDGFKRAGLEVHFDLDGELSKVPLAAGLATYRVVQESLSNAVKHAPGAPVTVQVRVEASDVDIRVVNPIGSSSRPSPDSNGARGTDGTGQGLRGMTERAELLGGTARAFNGHGTWKVEAHIPWSGLT